MLLALAEIRRARGRFSMLVGSVALVVVLLLFFQAVGGALSGGLSGAFTRAAADVWVYDAAARRNPQASVLPDGALEGVRGVDGVATASPVTFTTLEADGDPVAVVATDLGSPARPVAVDTGRRPQDRGQALVGTSAFVGEGLGGRVTLPGDTTVEVVGTASGATFNVLPTLFVDRETVARSVAAQTGRDRPLPTSAVAVTTQAAADAAALARRIGEQVDGVEAVTAAVAVDSLPGAGTVTRSFSILYALLYLVAAIVTAVFFLILTVQKRDSLVLIRAVGGGRRDLVVPVLLQVLLVVGGAVVIGTGLAVAILSASRDVFGAGVGSGTIVRSAGLLLLLGLGSGLLSVRRVLGIDPVEAVRGRGLQ